VSSIPPDPKDPILKADEAATEGADSFDDMRDSPAEIQRFPQLPLSFKWCARITGDFRRYDDLAIRFQRNHHRITYAAALLATLAVAAAIIGLSYYPDKSGIPQPPAFWLPSKAALEWLELVFASFAVGVVFWGWRSHYRDRWLLYRHQAESCRLLRYAFLIRPAVWRDGEGPAQQWIEPRLQEISDTSLKAAVVRASPHGPFEGIRSQLPQALLRDLTEYYLARRLNPQKEYLANRVQRNEFSDRIRRYVFVFFFGSIFAVVCKSGVRLLFRNERWELFLALLAALLPAAAAGVRTWRSAFEFSRNKARFEAAHAALRDLEGRLVSEGYTAAEGQEHGATGRRVTVREAQLLTQTQFSRVSIRTEEPASEGSGQEVDAYEILRDLAWCEHILETEHREWLRLMYETEWFG
jgi:hypothetical protein